jgi:hypothetical protein
VDGVLLAERAVLLGLHTIGMIFLFLRRIVVSLLAFGAGQGDPGTHYMHPPLMSFTRFEAGDSSRGLHPPCLGARKKKTRKIDGLCTIAKAADLVNKNMKYFANYFMEENMTSGALAQMFIFLRSSPP